MNELGFWDKKPCSVFLSRKQSVNFLFLNASLCLRSLILSVGDRELSDLNDRLLNGEWNASRCNYESTKKT